MASFSGVKPASSTMVPLESVRLPLFGAAMVGLVLGLVIAFGLGAFLGRRVFPQLLDGDQAGAGLAG